MRLPLALLANALLIVSLYSEHIQRTCTLDFWVCIAQPAFVPELKLNFKVGLNLHSSLHTCIFIVEHVPGELYTLISEHVPYFWSCI